MAENILIKIKDFFGFQNIQEFKKEWNELSNEDKEEIKELARVMFDE